MNTNLILDFYVIGIVIFGVLVGYFINRNDIKHNPRTKEDLLNNFLDNLEKKKKD
ncbi:hypothetical protein [Polynucleobacter sp. JS-JIR-5-A7]|uniref:hypothetical protein n=1 Tax=Polynucleobacter sp. JS-JIR-5-A7 TaxID=1758395 RepID=UPI001BFEC383|nr:hypothetical protein [Polynucleobacter sp. JS-JIR-5-A7]QWE06385.1 hypothetical protein AOC29_09810 [Polynucleobacter sp. JS-JIR-5-A7]